MENTPMTQLNTSSESASPGNASPRIAANRSMPPCSVIPELAYANVREASDWLCRVFGFSERLRIGNHRVQLNYGAGALIVVGLSDMGALSIDPAQLRALLAAQRVMLRVADVERHCEQARRLGARIVTLPADFPYGERQYTVEDIGGRRWTISQTIEDVHPKDWGGILFE
jgi:uncharacterized glyoxalase superfamily protein PhnB